MSADADTSELVQARETRPRHAFGAHFVEVRVDADTREIRVERALGVFAAGRIMNPRTARSQFIGAMSMGLSMGLMEEGVLDAAFGEWVNHDLAEYHVVTNADIRDVDAVWLEEFDDDVNPMGGKGIGCRTMRRPLLPCVDSTTAMVGLVAPLGTEPPAASVPGPAPAAYSDHSSCDRPPSRRLMTS